MSAPNRVLVIGASAAGLSVAQQLRNDGFTGSITVVGDEMHLPYDRPPLSKQVLSGDWLPDMASLVTEEGLVADGISVVLGSPAIRLDMDRKLVELGSMEHLEYDRLVIATGVRARTLAGTEGMSNLHSLRTLDDALRLKGELTAGRRLLIVGAGFIGLEVAATAIKLGCGVSVVEAGPSVLHGKMHPELAGRIMEQHVRAGVGFHLDHVVTDWSESGGYVVATLDDGTELESDVVLVGIGTVPNTEWLIGSSLVLDDGVLTNSRGLAAEDVYAIGDVARAFSTEMGKHIRVEHRMNVNDGARNVSADILKAPHAGESIPFFWTDQYEMKWQMYGTPRSDSVFEIIEETSDDRKTLVATFSSEGCIDAVVGCNAAKKMMRYRRKMLEDKSKVAAAVTNNEK